MYRMRYFIAAVAITLCIAPAAAAETEKAKPLTVSQALQVLAGLRGLDGRQVVVKQNGQDTVVPQPWEFKNGGLRMAISTNMSALAVFEKGVEEARVGIIKELTKGGGQIKPDDPVYLVFLKQYQDVIDRLAGGTEALTRIKAADLKLDVNEIPSSTLSALDPILDK